MESADDEVARLEVGVAITKGNAALALRVGQVVALMGIIRLAAVLGGANLAAWGWELAAFRGYPMLLGTAMLAYGLGLLHAVAADYIAAIDNVTRKLR